MKRDIVIYESLDRVKLETGRRSALFQRNDNGIDLKGAFAKLKVSDDLSKTLTLLSYLGIAYKGNAVVKDVLNWFGIFELWKSDSGTQNGCFYIRGCKEPDA